MQQLERRTWSGVEVRVRNGPKGPRITGHAAVFRSPSLDLGGFVEEIDEHAFDRTLKSGGAIRSFFNHDPRHVLGTVENGTLKVWTDSRGLVFEVDPPKTTWATDLIESIRRQDIRGASFQFRVRDRGDRWSNRPDGTSVRTLLDVDLLELGPVTVPAYPAADSQVRAMLEARSLRLDSRGRVQPATPTTTAGRRAQLEALRQRFAEEDERAAARQCIAATGTFTPLDHASQERRREWTRCLREQRERLPRADFSTVLALAEKRFQLGQAVPPGAPRTDPELCRRFQADLAAQLDRRAAAGW